MIAADTNILVRILVDDPGQPQQVTTARNLASRAKTLFIPQIVAVELTWVLQTAYRFSKNDIVMILEHLLHNSAFVLQNENRFLEAVGLFKANNCGFSDCLIAAESRGANCTLLTFDKKLARISGVELAQ